MTAKQSDTPNDVDCTTLNKKLMIGYQGWFGYTGDGSDLNCCWHWSMDNSAPQPSSLSVDMLPDTSDLADVYPTNMRHPDGTPVMLYSAYDESTVIKHFEWMQTYGLDGVMLQRFVSELGDAQVKAFRDQVAANARKGAEAYGRAFCVMYDISGSDESTFADILKTDWEYLVGTKKIAESTSYLRHNKKPLVAIWGLGFKDPPGRDDHPGTASQASEIIAYFQNDAQVTLLGGVPTYWRTPGIGDSKADQPTGPKWLDVYKSFDVLSPWSVNRYTNNNQADDFMKRFIIPERGMLEKLGKDYLPVVFPGYSAINRGDGGLNGVPRLGGSFWWKQIYNAVDLAKCTMIYGAMFDEMNEGTAMFKLVANQNDLPTPAELIPLNVPGEPPGNLKSDHYLWLAGETNRRLRDGIKFTANMPTRDQPTPLPTNWFNRFR